MFQEKDELITLDQEILPKDTIICPEHIRRLHTTLSNLSDKPRRDPHENADNSQHKIGK